MTVANQDITGSMEAFIGCAKALGDWQRVRAVLALQDGELCVCEIIELLGLAPSTVSRHMSILRRAGLVTARKDGRWTFYRLAGAEASSEVRAALKWALGLLAGDARRVRKGAGRRPEERCRKRAMTK